VILQCCKQVCVYSLIRAMLLAEVARPLFTPAAYCSMCKSIVVLWPSIHIKEEFYYSAPDRVAEYYCDDRVCPCVCLSVIIFLELHVRSLPNFLSMFPVAVARFSSGGVVIRYGFVDDVISAHKPRLLKSPPG